MRITKLFWTISAIVLSVGCVDAQERRGFSLWADFEQTSSNSLAVLFEGKDYYPAKQIEMADVIDRSSPEALLRSLYWACNKLDGDTYRQLFAPNELKGGFANDPNYKVGRLALRRAIKYGDFTILQIEITYPNQESVVLWPVRQIDGSYYATDALLAKDKAFEFINSYFAFAVRIGLPEERQVAEAEFFQPSFIYQTNFPFGDTNASPALVFRFQGERFGTNQVIGKWPLPGEAEFRTPQHTFASAISSLNLSNIENYSKLLHPDERHTPIRAGSAAAVGKTWDQWMRENFAEEVLKSRPKSVQIVEEVAYAYGTHALIFRDSEILNSSGNAVLFFRKSGTNWYISHRIEESSSKFPSFIGFPKAFNTRMFPQF